VLLENEAVVHQRAAMKRYLLAITALALPLVGIDATGQLWPTKPLHAIVPVGAGSSTDIVHRLVLEQLSQPGSLSSSKTEPARVERSVPPSPPIGAGCWLSILRTARA
jgi:hypothetical protein